MAEVGMTYSTGVQSTIGVLQLDALLSEGTDLAAQVSEYPVEEGSPISDHVTVESERLKLSGIITPSDVMQMTAGGRPKLMEAKAALRKILNDRAPVTISTGMDTYVDMIMDKCQISRTNEADHLNVDAEFVHIRKATLRKAAIPPDKTTGTATGKAGDTKTKAGKAGQSSPPAPQQSKRKKLLRTP